MSKRLLLLSSSTIYPQRFLDYADKAIQEFLTPKVKKALFIPYASVRALFDDYFKTVSKRFLGIGYEMESIHLAANPRDALINAEAVVVGGGNTFCLLRNLNEIKAVEQIRARVNDGMPYIGWSAGANIAAPTIKTVNSMPIVEVPTLAALNLVPFQINTHYTEFHPPEHQGESRDDRIAEFLELNPDVYVVGLREGSILNIENANITLSGNKSLRVFRKNRSVKDYRPQEDLRFLLSRIK